MKKTTIPLLLMISIFSANIQAQVPTIYNPNLQVTVTGEQIRSWAVTPGLSDSNLINLTFEGLGNNDEIAQFYNGGKSKEGFTGPDYGVNFSNAAISLITAQSGGSGNFITNTGQNTVMSFLSGCEINMNVTNGFTGSISFDYSAASGGVVSVFEGPDGTGMLLGSVAFQPMVLGSKGDPNGYFDSWKHMRLAFAGTGKSVIFLSVANQCGFDNITLGGEPHGKGVAEPAATVEKTKQKAGPQSFSSAIKYGKEATEKGQWFVAGSSGLGFSGGGHKSKSDGNVVESSKTSYFDFNFTPKAGYFFINNLIGGLYFDVDLYSEKSKESTGYSEKDVTFVVGPFARYYIPLCDKLIPYAEGHIGFGINNTKERYSSTGDWYKTKSGVFEYQIGAGATYFIIPSVGVDLFLGYAHYAYKYKDTGEESGTSSSKSVYGEFVLQFGIVCILDH